LIVLVAANRRKIKNLIENRITRVVVAGEAFVGGSRNIEYSSSFDDEAVEFISEWDGL